MLAETLHLLASLPRIGEGLALAAALTWAVSVILFKRSEAVTPQGLNLFKNLVSIPLLAATMLLLGEGIDWLRSGEDWWRLGISGVIGISVADTLFFVGLRRLGPGLTAILDCAYAPTIVLLAVVLLGERPNLGFALGAALVVGGILVVTTERHPATTGRIVSRRDLAIGSTAAVLGVITLAIGVILAKPVLGRGSLVEITLVRLIFGTLAQAAWIVVTGVHREVLGPLRPGPVWRTLLPASVLGTYVSTLLWLGGFKWADASVAAVLNQMTTVFVIVLGRIFLGETMSPRRALGAAIAVAGGVVILTW